MDTDSFLIYIKTEEAYEDIEHYVEKRFYTWNYEVNRPLPAGKILKNNWINERSTRQKNYDRIFCT